MTEPRNYEKSFVTLLIEWVTTRLSFKLRKKIIQDFQH
jgi:hypothetical protein